MRRVKYKKYAGVRIRGTVPQQPVNQDSLHLSRAAWLTAEVESGGMYGTVMNYDGTGITAGIHQAIAVYPRNLEDDKKNNDQGPLWELLARMRVIMADTYPLEHIFNRMIDYCDWHLDDAGSVRYKNGQLVPGTIIRDELTGTDGVMPTRGKGRMCSEMWVDMFHDTFSDPASFEIQQAFGKEHFVKRSKARMRFCEQRDLKRKTIHDYLYASDSHMSFVASARNSWAWDLAACMFWSFTVNAPGRALKELCKVADPFSIPGTTEAGIRLQALRLIRQLGISEYGRWDSNIKNGRYQRTRKAAMRVWPKDLFVGEGAVMPKDLED